MKLASRPLTLMLSAVRRSAGLRPRPLLALALVGSALAGGCMTPPQLPQSTAQALVAYEAEKSAQAQQMPAEVSLDAAKRTALAHNPDLRTALSRVERAMATLQRSRAAYLPRVDVAASASRTNPSTRVPLTGFTETYNTYTGGVSASYTLFDFFAREHRVYADRLGVEGSEAGYADAQRLLCQAVAQTYYGVLLAQQEMRVAQSDEEFNQQLLEETGKRRAADMATLTDELNFRIRLNAAKSRRIAAQSAFVSTGFALLELVGLPAVDVPPTVRLPDDLEVAAADPDTNQLVAQALARRPDLVRAERAARAATELAHAKYAELFPTVTANASAAMARFQELPEPNRRDTTLSAGVVASYNVFDAGDKRGAYRQAQADADAAQAQLQSARNALITSVRQQSNGIIYARQQVAVERENLALTKQTRDLELKKYQAGKSTITRINEVQNDVVNADAGLASAQVTLLQALARLQAEIGDNLPPVVVAAPVTPAAPAAPAP